LRERSVGLLSLDERLEIYLGINAGLTFVAIAALLERSVSTVSREVGGMSGRDLYRPMSAHRLSCERARRPKASKLGEGTMLCQLVTQGLEKLWSPEQISAWLRETFPDDETLRVSHETVYKSLYVQGRGELRRELAACLRTGRAVRKRRSSTARAGKIPGMINISERPAEIADRALPGHWEGDLIIGAGGHSAIGTLVERSTRYVTLLHLPGRHDATSVREAMTAIVKQLPSTLCRSITWDQGSEMTQHAQFSIDTNIDVYFCDPHSPWQRGTNENTNGLLRQYFPKGTDLSVHSAETLQAAADSLNQRPRKTLNWKTPEQAITTLLIAATA
jgi:IS30 family transposase